MVKRFITAALAACIVVPVSAALPVRTLYVDAMAKERAVRAALAGQATSEAVLRAVRTVVATYESLVRQYPASSYSDKALWQAGRLSLDAFDRFGQPEDKEAGLRLLRALATAYPGSQLAKRVPEQLSSAGQRGRKGSPEQVVRTPGAKIATITGIRRAILSDVVRVIVELDAEVLFHEERIAGPARIFVDFPATRTTVPLADQTLRFDRDTDVVRQVRIGRHPNETTRVVLDATGVSSYSVYPLYSPYRLVIDCVRETTSAPTFASSSFTPAGPAPSVPGRLAAVHETARQELPIRRLAGPAGSLPLKTPWETAALAEARAAPIASRRLGSTWDRRLPAVAPAGAAALKDTHTGTLTGRGLAAEWGRALPSVAPSARLAASDAHGAIALTSREGPLTTTSSPGPPGPHDATASVKPPTGRAPVVGGGFSMARQLGLGVSRIVIDPGHGGHDPGAKGKGITESELVLDVALRLEKLLEDTHLFEVILTRRTDEFVALPERTAVANRESADLFLSIHANANTNAQARGVETYFLNFATNMGAAAVAARENAGSGQVMAALPDFVKAIALNNKLDESRDFATLVQHSMIERLRGANKGIKNLGVKQAPFVVLIGASMPSVLAEVSFLTNTQEVKLLKNDGYRQRIADALFTAVSKYQSSLAGAQAVAQQR